jgi:hypothetical protein
MLSLLRRRDFSLVWTASLISATSDWVLLHSLVALGFLPHEVGRAREELAPAATA